MKVAVLAPQAAGRRGVYAHKAMHPFDRQDGVCRWPTITVVDDARITPDRTWSAPKGDEIWAGITRDIRAASEKAREAEDAGGGDPPSSMGGVGAATGSGGGGGGGGGTVSVITTSSTAIFAPAAVAFAVTVICR